jgi:hypothetical protein
MPTIRDNDIELSIAADASSIAITNRATGARWLLDPDTALADGSGSGAVTFGPSPSGSRVAPAAPFDPRASSVETLADRALLVTRRGPAGQLTLRFELTADGCRVTALADRSTVTACALPGAFRPEGVDALPVALPKNQGIWHKGTGAPLNFHFRREGHGGFTMPFFAAVGPADALIAIIEDEHDACIRFGKSPEGRTIAAALAYPSLGKLRYNRSVLLRFVAPDLTSICASYRRYVKDAGNLVTWEEKVAARPNLEKLFGAMMCFIGYCQDADLDYAASFKRLKSLGFDRAFVYPLAMGNIVEGYAMGGRPPIDIRRHLPLLAELGYISAGWMWTEDVPADGPDIALNADGKPFGGWQIDEFRWVRGCPVRQVALSNRIQDARMKGFTGHHFDVTASRDGIECFHPDHPLDRRDDAAWRRKVLATATRRGLVVSSEGFWGHASPSYDIGSVKIALPLHDDWFTVPMTSLVYHDSMIHDWWEVDNYNNPHHRTQHNREKAYFPLGGGYAPLQAAFDALAGYPPNVMPFGSQYAFIEGQMSKGTELYRYNLDSPEVKAALEIALPLTRLHRRIGKLPLVSHETLSPDGAVQATTFKDGTRVIVNFSSAPRDVPDSAPLAPTSWRAT